MNNYEEQDRIEKEEVYSYYNKFFELIRHYAKEHYRQDVVDLYLKEDDTLTPEQESKIREYWSKYVEDFDINFHKFYVNRNGTFDVRYIPDDVYVNIIDPYFNNRELEAASSDKNYLDTRLKGFRLPKTYVHLINGIFLDKNYNILTKEEAVKILINKTFVAKPSILSFGGQNVSFFKKAKKSEIEEYLNNLELDNMIFQEKIVQSETMAYLHEKSLNTLRIMTLIINDKVYALKPIIRVVTGDNSVGTEGVNELFIGVKDDGTLNDYGFDIFGERITEGVDGKLFKNVKIKQLDESIEICKKAALRFPHFRLISWDIAINKKNEPVIIEANLNMGNVDIMQPSVGPVFGDLTETVLDEVFFNKKEKRPYFNVDVYM